MAIGSLGLYQMREDVRGSLFDNLDQKEDFENYLGIIKAEGFISINQLEETLHHLKYLISLLHARKFDGVLLGWSIPYLHEQIFFGGTSKTEWWFTYNFGNHQNSAFHCLSDERGLDVLHVYIRIKYEALIEEIEVSNKQIHVTWKS